MQEEAQAQQQAQQQQAQVQMQKDQADIMLTQAKATSEMAKVDDLESSAERKNMQSDLDLVKMMIGLEDMQFNQFRNAFELAQTVKLANQSAVSQNSYI